MIFYIFYMIHRNEYGELRRQYHETLRVRCNLEEGGVTRLLDAIED